LVSALLFVLEPPELLPVELPDDAPPELEPLEAAKAGAAATRSADTAMAIFADFIDFLHVDAIAD